MENVTTRVVDYRGQFIRYELERKPVKNINLRVRRDGTVHVSANSSVCVDEVDRLVQRRGGSILAGVERVRAIQRSQPHRYVSGEVFYLLGDGLRLKVRKAERDCVTCDGRCILVSLRDPKDQARKEREVKRFLDRRCREVFARILTEQHGAVAKYGVDMPKLRIRTMDARWSSSEPRTGTVTVNRRLIAAPEVCISYVMLHELCHFVHPNHSKEFHELMTTLMPDWQTREERLNNLAL